MTWMSAEMKSRMRATAPLHYVASGNENEKREIGNKCWICKMQAHWTDERQKFLALHHNDRKNIVQENHACFSCLKRAGRDHNITTCRQRKQCTVIENGKPCEQYHHPILHQKTGIKVRASISSMSENSEALLPVISLSIHGRDGLYKHGNILLDSGAQISLIRQETAEALGLDGKKVFISITKVASEEEEMTTKVFKVQVPPLDSKKAFLMKVIDIPCTSDNGYRQKSGSQN